MFTNKEANVLATLMQGVSRTQFPHDLKRLLGLRHKFSTFLVISYHPERLPVSHYHWIENPALLTTYLNGYLDGAFQLDPFYQLAISDFRPGYFRLRDIAPDRFYSTEYYRHYYGATKLQDEVGILVRQSNGTVTAISISRNEKLGAFSRAEIADWKTLGPILTELLRQYGENVLVPNQRISPSPAQNREQEIRTSIAEFSEKHLQKSLTKREVEIITLILRGHSSLSVSAILKIALGTVKVHRKNIYRKLEISSQAELFNKFHNALIQ